MIDPPNTHLVGYDTITALVGYPTTQSKLINPNPTSIDSISVSID